MPDAVEVAIEAALLTKLVAFGAAHSIIIEHPNIALTNPPAPKSGPGVNPVVYGKYLRATFLPADSFGLGVSFDSTNQHYGLLQVDVFYGVGGGELAPARIASNVIAYFDRGLTLTRDGFAVRIINKPRRGQLIVDGAWTFIPVRIPYLSFASNPA